MSARRSRIVVRPNVARPPRAAGVVLQTPVKEVSSVKNEEKTEQASSNAAKEEKIEKEEKNEPVAPKPSVMGSRRSRIKPQVQLKARGNAPVAENKAAEPAAKTPAPSTGQQACPDKDKQPREVEKNNEESTTKDVTKADEGMAAPVTPDPTLTSPKLVVKPVEQASESMENCSTDEIDANGKAVEGSQSVDIVKLTPNRRSRFPKAKPNLMEAGRSRMRHPSMSEAEDVTKKLPSPQKSTPQPTARLSSPPDSGPGPVCAAPTEMNDEVDGVDKAKPVEKKQVCKKQRRTMGKLTTPVDRSKMTMRELIYNNPINNPTKSTLEEMERKKKKKKGDGDGESDVVSVAGSAISERAAGGSKTSEIVVSLSRPESVAGQDVPDGKSEEAGETTEETPVPQVRIGEDGLIILNEESLVIPTVAPTEVVVEGDIIDETYKSYNATSFYGRRTKTKQWTLKETKKFYVALSMIGSDFSLMTKLFPNRNRTEIKRKFKKEEKIHKDIIDMALTDKKGFNLSLLDGPLSDSDDEEQENKKIGKKSARGRNKVKSEKESGTNTDKGSAQKSKTKGPKRKAKKKGKNYYEDSSSDDERVDSTVIDLSVMPEERVDSQTAQDTGGKEEGEVEEVMGTIHQPTRYGRQPKRSQPFNLDGPPSQRPKIDPASQSKERGEQITQHLLQHASLQSPQPVFLGNAGPRSAGQGQFIPLSNLGSVRSPPVPSDLKNVKSPSQPSYLGTISPPQPSNLGSMKSPPLPSNLGSTRSPPLQSNLGSMNSPPLLSNLGSMRSPMLPSNLGSMKSPTMSSNKTGLVFVSSKQHGSCEGQKDKKLIHVYLVSPPGTPNPLPCASPPLSPQPLLSPPGVGRLVGSPPPVSSGAGLILPQTTRYSPASQGITLPRSQLSSTPNILPARSVPQICGQTLPAPLINIQRQSFTVTSSMNSSTVITSKYSGPVAASLGTLVPATASPLPSVSRDVEEETTTTVTKMADGTITIVVKQQEEGVSNMEAESAKCLM